MYSDTLGKALAGCPLGIFVGGRVGDRVRAFVGLRVGNFVGVIVGGSIRLFVSG